MDDMLEDFHIEAEELFDEAEENLLKVEKADNYQNCFNAIFRAFHSVKGAAGMFGILKLQEHMHFVENLLEQKKADDTMSPVMIDYLLNAVDSARKILKGEEVSFNYFDPDKEKTDQNPEKQIMDKKKKEEIKKEVEKREDKLNSLGHVVIVDDEVDILTLVENLFSEIGYEVHTFLNPLEALTYIKDHHPDIVISDFKMPQMNGLELMIEINKIRPHLPLLLMSGFVTKEICINSVAQGVAGIIEKPIDDKKMQKMASVLVNRYKNLKLLNKSLDLLIYQFESFDKFLLEKYGEARRDTFRNEIKSLLKQKKILFEKLVS